MRSRPPWTRRRRKSQPFASCSPNRVCSMNPSPPLNKPVPLEKSHDLVPFDCGVVSLNDYIKKHALQNNQNRSARTYVATRSDKVVGYYTLAAGSVSKADA